MLTNISYLIMFAIIMMAISIVLYTVFFAEKNNVGEQYKPLKMPSGFADRYWNPIIFSILEKNQKPGSKGRNEGSNNSPSSSAQKLCATEGDIKDYVKNHYNNELMRIGRFKMKDSSKDVQDAFREYKRDVKSNGYQQEFNKMVASWNAQLESYKLRVSQAVKQRREARDAVRQFKIQNNLIAGRQPQVHDKIFQFLKICVPFALFFTEVGLNISGLAKAVGGGEAIVVSFMLSSINVGLSFAVGILVLTHFFNPVGASKPKIVYIISFILYAFLLVYINSMMGVFRALSELADLQMDPIAAQALTDAAIKEAVMPFDNMGSITFGGAFLMLVGFFFAFLSLIDAYFFKDPIPGYGELGKKRHAAEKRVEKIKLEDTQLFTQIEHSQHNKLTRRNEERLHANEAWKFMIDELQTMSSRYDTFRDSLEQALISGIDMYRRQNIKFRTEPAPAYFETAVDASFIKTFEQNYPALSSELMSDQESEQNLTQWAEKIEREYAEMQNKYVEFFESEKHKLFEVVKGIDDGDD